MRPRTWLGVAAAATTACGILAWGCSSDNNGGTADAGADASDGGTASDSGTVSDATPCPDVNLLAPVDAAANPTAASCQACVAGIPMCLTAFMTCNSDCVCKEALVAFAACTADGGTGGGCGLAVLTDPAFAAASELQTLFGCESSPTLCATQCNPTAGDAGDAGTGTDAADAGTIVDAADGGG
jgi:hypothetical protein